MNCSSCGQALPEYVAWTDEEAVLFSAAVHDAVAQEFGPLILGEVTAPLADLPGLMATEVERIGPEPLPASIHQPYLVARETALVWVLDHIANHVRGRPFLVRLWPHVAVMREDVERGEYLYLRYHLYAIG